MPEAERILPDVPALVDQYATYPAARACCRTRSWRRPSSTTSRSSRENGVEVPDDLGRAHRGLRHAEGRRRRRRSTRPSRTPGRSRRAGSTTPSAALSTSPTFFDAAAPRRARTSDRTRRCRSRRTSPSRVDQMIELATNYTNDGCREPRLRRRQPRLRQGRGRDVPAGPVGVRRDREDRADLDLGTFPLPMTDDPDDRKVRVNLDLARGSPRRRATRRRARDLPEYLFQPEVIDDVQRGRSSASAPTTDAAPVTDPRIVGHEAVLRRRRSSTRAPSQLDPADDPDRELRAGASSSAPTPSRRSAPSTPTGRASPCAS